MASREALQASRTSFPFMKESPMKQATHDALSKFLDSRLSAEATNDVWDVIARCRKIRQEGGKDDPELTLRTSELLRLLEEDLMPDEYDRAKGLILDDYSQAQDRAAIRAVKAMDEHRRAIEDVRPLLGEGILACDDAAGIYRAGLERLGIDAASAPLDAARAMYRQMGSRLKSGYVPAYDKAASDELAQRFGVAGPRLKA